MRRLKTNILIIAVMMIASQFVTAQEGLPIYSDYLTDN